MRDRIGRPRLRSSWSRSLLADDCYLREPPHSCRALATKGVRAVASRAPWYSAHQPLSCSS